jgi:hypothetical protein
VGGNTTTNAGKLRASDFADDSYIKAEQGVFIEATPSIMRTDLGVTSASDVEDGDFLQSDGTDWVPKSISEMKTLLGLPSEKYIGYVVGVGSTGDTAFTVFEHLDTKGITLSFAKDGSTAGLYNFTALTSLGNGKGYIMVKMTSASDYSKKYSIEVYSTGASSAYKLRVYKDGVLSDIDNGDTISFVIRMEDY